MNKCGVGFARDFHRECSACFGEEPLHMLKNFVVWNVYFMYQCDVNDALCHWKVSLISRLHALSQFHSCRTFLCFFTPELPLMISQGSQKFKSSLRVWTAPASTQTPLSLFSAHSQQPRYEVDIGAWEGPGRSRCPEWELLLPWTLVVRRATSLRSIISALGMLPTQQNKASGASQARSESLPRNLNRVLLVGGCYTHFDLFMSRVGSFNYKLSFFLFRERSKAQNRLVWEKNNNTGETTNYEQSSNNTHNEPK